MCRRGEGLGIWMCGEQLWALRGLPRKNKRKHGQMWRGCCSTWQQLRRSCRRAPMPCRALRRYLDAYVYTYPHARMHARTHARKMSICLHTRTHTRSRTHTHTHTDCQQNQILSCLVRGDFVLAPPDKTRTVYADTRMNACVRACVRAYTRASIQAYVGLAALD